MITVNYTSGEAPTSITQTWKDDNGHGNNITHDWVTFTYTTLQIDTNFSTAITSVFGPTDGTYIKVLQKITRADGSHTDFTYNSYGQVTKVSNIAADSGSHVLNYVRTNLDSLSSPQADCPRFTSTFTKVENFNNNDEIEVKNDKTTGQSYSVPGHSDTGMTRIQAYMVGHPDNLRSITFVGSSGWREGLPAATEDCLTTSDTSCSDRKRWTWTRWKQDDENQGYKLNPRVTESLSGDSSNTKRSTTEYYPVSTGSPIALYGLVKETIAYKSDLSTPEKKIVTEYNLDTDYTVQRRIIGLPKKVEVYGYGGSSLNLVSKTTYAYDQGYFTDSGLNQNISPVQHDNTNFSSGLTTGRGNPTSAIRWNAEYPDEAGYAITSSQKYNTAGSVVSKTDAMGKVLKIGYADDFNVSGSFNTYAYPTTVTDVIGNVSNMRYRYDIGANVRAKSPTPAGNSSGTGKEMELTYDDKGRIIKEQVLNFGGPYTRYEYPTNGIQAKIYTTIVDVNSNGADSNDEVLSETWFDGAGRVRRSRTEHPNSDGGWAATQAEYDKLGRVKRATPPTEVSVNTTTNVWTPDGDDDRGLDSGSNPVWLWTRSEYDWMGRATQIIPPDSTGSDGKDTLYSYEGCGCAGNQVTTIEGENIVETTWSGSPMTTLGRRKQKITADPLGRNIKTEVYNWNGTDIYSTAVNTFNGRDQITSTIQYEGGVTGSVHREVTMDYDGFGRMKMRHYPIEASGTNTTWTYNNDDTINTVTDPRGVVTAFGYSSTTGLMNGIQYTVPGGLSNVDDTPDVTFTYDNVGNRTLMTDGTGTTTYAYDQISQMTSETKSLTGLSGSFTIDYTYNLTGALKTITDPQNSNQLATYEFDKAGRITGGGQTNQSTNLMRVHDTEFRAWGAMKEYHSTIGQNTTSQFIKLGYDTSLAVSGYEGGTSTTTYDHVNFERYADGRVKQVEQVNSPTFDRRYRYDHVGRVIQGQSGYEANARTDIVLETPYRNNITYNSFDEPTNINGKHWPRTIPTFSPTLDSAGRISTSTYDASGNIKSERIDSTPTIINRTMNYDAAGRNVHSYDPLIHSCCENNHTYDYSYDGDGRRVKQTDLSAPPSGSTNTSTLYQIRSTVLDGDVIGKITTYDWSSNVSREFIIPVNDTKLSYNDMLGGDLSWTAPEGIRTYGRDGGEFDTLGANVGAENPYNTGEGGGGYPSGGGDPTNYTRCTWDGVPASCGVVFKLAFNLNPIRTTNKQQKPTAPSGPTRLNDGPGPANPVGGPQAGNTHASMTTLTLKPVAIPNQSGKVQPASVPDPCSQNPDGSFNCSVEIRMPPPDVRPDRSLMKISTQITPRPLVDCEKYMAMVMTNTPGVVMGDATDGDSRDPYQKSPQLETLADGEVKAHNHLYNPLDNLFAETPLFAPAGGQILGGVQFHNKSAADPDGQSMINVYYPSLGGEKDIILQFYHIGNFAPQVMPDGRIYVGTFSKNGLYMFKNKVIGYHIHINAWKWLGGKNRPNKNVNPGAVPKSWRRMKNIFRLSKLC